MSGRPDFERKIVGREQLTRAVGLLARPLVATNGVFDILHLGHVTYLAQARSLGASAADPASHVPLVLLIDERGKPRPWRRLDGLADARVLTAALREAMAQPVE